MVHWDVNHLNTLNLSSMPSISIDRMITFGPGGPHAVVSRLERGLSKTHKFEVVVAKR